MEAHETDHALRGQKELHRGRGRRLSLTTLPHCAGDGFEACRSHRCHHLLRVAPKKKEEEAALQKRKVEEKNREEEERLTRLNDRVHAELPLTSDERAAWRRWMGLPPKKETRRKMKKRRMRLPRSSPFRRRVSGCPLRST